MPCENCRSQFTIFKRKKGCGECRRLFCSQCSVKVRNRVLCQRCVILTKRPLIRNELQLLKTRDLIIFLQSKHIPTAGCVEKDDLVNLVMTHVDTTSSSGSSPRHDESSFRSYINNLAFSGVQDANPSAGTRSPNNNENNNFFGDRTTNNAISYLRESCQAIFGNISENFKFESNSSNPATSPPGSNVRASGTSSSPTNVSPSGGYSEPAPHVPVPRSVNSRPPMHRQHKPKPKMKAAVQAESGCDCSEDEASQLLRTTSQSTNNLIDMAATQRMVSNLESVPGPSGIDLSRSKTGCNSTPKIRSNTSSNSDTDSEFSSFEELVAMDTNVEEATADKVNVRGRSNLECPPKMVQRRRSDGCLTKRSSIFVPTPSATSNQCLQESMGGRNNILINHNRTVDDGCCLKCGKKKDELKRRLKRFQDQLNELSTTDIAIRPHLEAILNYLERARLSSIELSDIETEDGSGDGAVIQAASTDRTLSDLVPTSDNANVTIPTEAVDKPPTVYKRKLIKLDDINSSSDLEELSVKQLKEILMLNRVDFKGCCEKRELVERVQRLLDDYHSCPSVEKLPTDDLCKICMDAPIECVLLECGHCCSCTNCGKVLSECPLCRQYIIRVVRLFRS